MRMRIAMAALAVAAMAVAAGRGRLMTAKRFNPTGGVIAEISTSLMTMTPNQIGSRPRDFSTG